jgi:hypothetical protein
VRLVGDLEGFEVFGVVGQSRKVIEGIREQKEGLEVGERIC